MRAPAPATPKPPNIKKVKAGHYIYAGYHIIKQERKGKKHARFVWRIKNAPIDGDSFLPYLSAFLRCDRAINYLNSWRFKLWVEVKNIEVEMTLTKK